MVDTDDGTSVGGLKGVYKWTVDALFGSGVSPSAKYRGLNHGSSRQRYSQDDTNHSRYKPLSSMRSRSRSNSWSVPVPQDPSFYKRYDLLPPISSDDEDYSEEDKLQYGANSNRGSPMVKGLMNPAPVVPKQQNNGYGEFDRRSTNPLFTDPTDTFARRKTSSSLMNNYRSSTEGIGDTAFIEETRNININGRDPLIAKLFGRITSPKKMANLPGKFPSPAKATLDSNRRRKNSVLHSIGSGRVRETSTSLDDKKILSEYMDIISDLDRNNENLSALSEQVEDRNQRYEEIDTEYKKKYYDMRNELIKELKQSKKTHDNYYLLYNKYKELKEMSSESNRLKSTIYNLESEILEQGVSKNREIQNLNEKILKLESRCQELEAEKLLERDKYELRIASLEAKLREQNISNGKNYFSDYSYSHRSREFSPDNYRYLNNYFSEEMSDFDADIPYKNGR
ncbi:hypothetical protein B1J92_H00594g [Nakaseomyces glabratus]|nr:hypothetical protein B1J91_H00594g [Nakaseomyces glabratus]OXB47982.1 hypothetical protein B1J92_H00594g [Nakaseomyces glabratus]